MKRLAKGGGIGAAILACTAAIAWATPANVTTTALNQFSAASFNHDAGTVATLTHTGGGPHNVTSDALLNGQPLFSSATIPSGSTPINGTEFIPAGTYPFTCTFHGPTMSSSLVVTGTPLPRPSTPSTPTGTNTAQRKKKCKKKGKVFRRGRCVKKRKHRRR